MGDTPLVLLRHAAKLRDLLAEIESLDEAADTESRMHREQLQRRVQDIVATMNALKVQQETEPEDAPQAVDILSMLDELAALCRKGLAWAKKHGYPGVEDYPQYPRAREIGEMLNALGGLKAMQQAVHHVYAHVNSPDGGQAALLEYGWSGIGNWQS